MRIVFDLSDFLNIFFIDLAIKKCSVCSTIYLKRLQEKPLFIQLLRRAKVPDKAMS